MSAKLETKRANNQERERGKQTVISEVSQARAKHHCMLHLFHSVTHSCDMDATAHVSTVQVINVTKRLHAAPCTVGKLVYLET